MYTCDNIWSSEWVRMQKCLQYDEEQIIIDNEWTNYWVFNKTDQGVQQLTAFWNTLCSIAIEHICSESQWAVWRLLSATHDKVNLWHQIPHEEPIKKHSCRCSLVGNAIPIWSMYMVICQRKMFENEVQEWKHPAKVNKCRNGIPLILQIWNGNFHRLIWQRQPNLHYGPLSNVVARTLKMHFRVKYVFNWHMVC